MIINLLLLVLAYAHTTGFLLSLPDMWSYTESLHYDTCRNAGHVKAYLEDSPVVPWSDVEKSEQRIRIIQPVHDWGTAVDCGED